MSLLALILIILLIGAVFGYGTTPNVLWIILAVVLIFALFGNYTYTR